MSDTTALERYVVHSRRKKVSCGRRKRASHLRLMLEDSCIACDSPSRPGVANNSPGLLCKFFQFQIYVSLFSPSNYSSIGLSDYSEFSSSISGADVVVVYRGTCTVEL